MNCYVKPYEGAKDYLFLSFCHQDETVVYPIIERLSIEGFRVWFDEGIHPGDDWPEVIASHLSRARVCVAVISRASAESHNCRNEVSFAIANNKPFVSVVAEDFPMPLGMQLQLSGSNYIRKYEYETEAFYRKLLASPSLSPCRNPGEFASPLALSAWQAHLREYEEASLPSANSEGRGLSVDPAWFGERQKLQAEIAKLSREREEAARQLREEKQRLMEEREKQRREEEQLRQQRLALEAEARKQAGEDVRKTETEGPETREQEEEKQKAEEEARRKAEEEARRKAEEEARRKAEEEARRKAEEEARRKAEEEVRRKAEEEVRRKAEEEARRKAEEEARRKAEEEARRKAEEETRRKAREDALLVRMKTAEIFRVAKSSVQIGRSTASDIVLTGNKALSRRHVEISRNGKGYTLLDTSTSFVEVNGIELHEQDYAPLGEFADILLSDEQFFFLSGSRARQVEEERRLRILCCRETGEAKLFVGERLPLNRYHKWRQNILGDQRISRSHHAELLRSGEQTLLRDEGSAHGTFCNGRRLSPGEEVALKHGDVIAIVETEFVYYESVIG